MDIWNMYIANGIIVWNKNLNMKKNVNQILIEPF